MTSRRLKCVCTISIIRYVERWGWFCLPKYTSHGKVIRQIFGKCTWVQMPVKWNNRGNSMAITRLIPCTMHYHWRTSVAQLSWECRFLSPHIFPTKCALWKLLWNLFLSWRKSIILGYQKIKFVSTKLNIMRSSMFCTAHPILCGW